MTRIQFRCSPEQKERWTEAAGGEGFLSEWMRDILDRESVRDEPIRQARTVGLTEIADEIEAERLAEEGGVNESSSDHGGQQMSSAATRESGTDTSPPAASPEAFTEPDRGTQSETAVRHRTLTTPSGEVTALEWSPDPPVGIFDGSPSTPERPGIRVWIDDAPPEPEEPEDGPDALEAPRAAGTVAGTESEADEPTRQPAAKAGSASGPASPLQPSCVNAVMHWQLAAGQACRYCKGVA